MAKQVIQSKVIIAAQKDIFEDQLNHFLTNIEPDNFVNVKYQEIQGQYSALVL
jgi:hypothetical protein